MRIRNCVLKLPKTDKGPLLPAIAESMRRTLGDQSYPLRFSIVSHADQQLDIECTVLDFKVGEKYAESFEQYEIENPQVKTHQSDCFGIVQIIPTGIRCEFGGYAGDAAPVTNLLATVADAVITHPNAVNASDINEMSDNILYVEGKSLDDFMLGHLGLRRSRSNKIGTFVDPAGYGKFDDVLNVLNAARTAAGIDCDLCAFLNAPLEVHTEWTDSGCASGAIGNIEGLLQAVETLIASGAKAVGGLSVIAGVDDVSFDGYVQGRLPNPSGVVEAIITHLISKVFRVPTAHAPLPYYKDRETTAQCPRAAAEFISRPHYFCVLKGLHTAPELIKLPSLAAASPEIISLNNVGAVVAPASALGGIPTLAADLNGIPIIAVKENKTILNVTHDVLPLDNVIPVESYIEAAGVVSALKSGIALDSLKRPVRSVTVLSEPGHRASPKFNVA